MVRRRYPRYSRTQIWMVAEAGIASSAPSTPNRLDPNRTAISTMIGCTLTERAWMRGWMTVISRARDATGQVPAYGHLRRLLDEYHEMRVLDFDAATAVQFQTLRAGHRRANTMDLKIAAIAIT